MRTRGEWLFGAIAGIAVLGFAAVFSNLGSGLRAAERPTAVPEPALDNPRAPGALQTAVLAGGCFWGTQGVFEHVIGVHKVLAGYAGGSKSTAHYDTVSSGTSGHAESIQVQFDPAKISYGQVLRVFFSVAHDPTQLNRQGPIRRRRELPAPTSVSCNRRMFSAARSSRGWIHCRASTRPSPTTRITWFTTRTCPTSSTTTCRSLKISSGSCPICFVTALYSRRRVRSLSEHYSDRLLDRSRLVRSHCASRAPAS
jgi:hypothetical protein